MNDVQHECSMSDVLARQRIEGWAPGKTILLGEHAAVYGFPALAVPLNDIRIYVSIEPAEFSEFKPANWNSVWRFLGSGAQQTMDAATLHRLHCCLGKAVQIVFGVALDSFLPQCIVVRSEIPLGAGMGGSAALSVALLRVLLLAAQEQKIEIALPSENFLQAANELDAVFHGNASGLDVAAVASNSPILFRRGNLPQPVLVKKEFWLTLVDSGSRSPTIDMVRSVSEQREGNPKRVNALLENLGFLASIATDAMQKGDLNILGDAMNQAHARLHDLNVSNSAMDAIALALRTKGALGAKLTGAGGGGLVLGLFESNPLRFIEGSFDSGNTYVTKVSVK